MFANGGASHDRSLRPHGVCLLLAGLPRQVPAVSVLGDGAGVALAVGRHVGALQFCIYEKIHTLISMAVMTELILHIYSVQFINVSLLIAWCLFLVVVSQ
jgi:hypothetical protein